MAVHIHFERDGNNMISGCTFGKIERQNCFEDGTVNTLYFPVMDSTGFPPEIRSKTGEIIENMLWAYEAENGCELDLSALCLNARMVVFMDKTGKWSYEIAVVISGKSGCDDVWIEESYPIRHENYLFEPFKAYFMERLERNLFKGWRFNIAHGI